ncbi:MAG: anhydro-N-acetylmuramic acid kinase [Armatimonadetes bacterium]|nr:anhydro-N-acetylmuramic acid kinase [Armatimonadota bacterium]
MTDLLQRYQSLARPRVVGLMSGTSADGIDAALVELGPEGPRVLRFTTTRFPPAIREMLFELFEDRATVRQVARANVQLGELFAEAALEVMGADKADLVSSHGQTVAHLPESRATLQIAEPSVIAYRTGCLTAADFRPADMAAGGQGAPLVPFFDAWLLRSAEVDRVALNIGGIANITWIPGDSDEIFGCDTGPGNVLMDALAEKLVGEPFDRNGQLAARGKVLPELLGELLAHPYLRERGPKSTGREVFGRPLAEGMLGRGEPADLLRTAAAFTACSIASHVQPLVRGPTEMVMAGGGCDNPVLMEELRRHLPGSVSLRRFDDFGVPAAAREAVAFAYLGHCTAHGRPSNAPGATGASRPCVLGKLVFP